MCLPQVSQPGFGQKLRLIEAAAASARSEQRHGDHQRVSRHLRQQLGDGLAHPRAKQARSHGGHSLEFQEVKKLAGSIVIGCKGHGTRELGRSQPAHHALGDTKRGRKTKRLRRQGIAATTAKRTNADPRDAAAASPADRHPAQVEKRISAQPAIGGKQDIREIVSRRGSPPAYARPTRPTSQNTGDRAPSRRSAFRQCAAPVPRRTAISEPNIPRANAEDEPLSATEQEETPAVPMFAV